MNLFSVFLSSACFAATLKRGLSDCSGSEQTPVIKQMRTDVVPFDIWQIILSFGKFEFAPELALTNMALRDYVSKTVHNYLKDNSTKSDLLDEESILRLMPLFLHHHKKGKGDTDLPSVFAFFFKHAECHEFAFKVFKAWKCLGLRLIHDQALLNALNESVLIPSEHPVTIFLNEPFEYYRNFPYSFVYPAIMLRCGSFSSLVWKELFHILLNIQHLGHDHPYENFRKFIRTIWDELPKWQQTDTLDRISRTEAYKTGTSECEDFNALSNSVEEIVGCPLRRISFRELESDLDNMDESEFFDMILLLELLELQVQDRGAAYYLEASQINRLFGLLVASIEALDSCNLESLKDHRSWGASKLLILRSCVSDPTVNDEVRQAIANHVWKVSTLDGMLIFSFLIRDRSHLLIQSFKELISASKNRSILEVMTSYRLKFIALKNIDELDVIVREWATNELLQIVRSYVAGQKVSPLNSKLANPDLSNLLVKCIRNDPVLSSKISITAILQTLPTLKRYL